MNVWQSQAHSHLDQSFMHVIIIHYFGIYLPLLQSVIDSFCGVKENADERPHHGNSVPLTERQAARHDGREGGKLCRTGKLGRNWAAKHGCSRGPWAMQLQWLGATSDKSLTTRLRVKWASGVWSPFLSVTADASRCFFGARHQITLIGSLWTRSLYTPYIPLLSLLNPKREEKGISKGGRCNTLSFNVREVKWLRSNSITTIFPFHWGKHYFIHAISVHSSAGASLDSQCHLPTNTLINGSDVSTACSWGVAVGDHVVQEGYIQHRCADRGAENIHSIVQ